MPQITVKKKQLNEITNSLFQIDYSIKNLFTIRAEKLLKKIGEIGTKVNEELQDKRDEFAETDEKGRFIFETITTVDKQGASRTENTSNYKYTREKAKQRDEEVRKIWEQEIDIPVYLIELEKNKSLYKQIFKQYSPSTISTLAVILLEVPLDDDGFVKEEFVLEMTAE